MADLTKLGVWTVNPPEGVTCTINASTGVLTVTGMTTTDALIPITFTYGNIVRATYIKIERKDDPPTNPTNGGTTGTSGTVANTSTLGSTAGTAYNFTSAVSATLSVIVGAAGKVQCSTNLAFKRLTTTDSGVTGTRGKWQWRVPGGTWADISLEVSSTQNASTTVNSGDPTLNLSGSINVSGTAGLKTGLTPGSTYEFRFVWKRVDISDTPSDVYRLGGTLTADGTVS